MPVLITCFITRDNVPQSDADRFARAYLRDLPRPSHRRLEYWVAEPWLARAFADEETARARVARRKGWSLPLDALLYVDQGEALLTFDPRQVRPGFRRDVHRVQHTGYLGVAGQHLRPVGASHGATAANEPGRDEDEEGR